jgi:hypothetical protein
MPVRPRWKRLHIPQTLISFQEPTPPHSPLEGSHSTNTHSNSHPDPQIQTVQSQILSTVFNASISSSSSANDTKSDQSDLEWRAFAYQSPKEITTNHNLFDQIDDISYYPTSYIVGRALKKLCITPIKPSTGRPQGWFETNLRNKIDSWREDSFDNFLVDINIWPQTSYEPDYSTMGADFDKSIKMFNVASPGDLVFPGTGLMPFRRIWGTDFQIRTRHQWITVEEWLEDWKHIAKAADYNVEAAYRHYFYSLGVTNLIFHLPRELKWMVYDHLIEDVLEFGTDASIFGSRVRLPPDLFESWPPFYWSRHRLSLDSILFECELAQDFTQYLLQQYSFEFQSPISFINFIERAPLRVLYNAQHIRFLWTNVDSNVSCCPKRKNDPRSNFCIFDFLASPYSPRPHPDWTILMLAYLPMLSDIEVGIQYDPWKFPHRWNFINNDRPCRLLYTNFLFENMFPWIVLPGVKVSFIGAIRSSVKRRIQGLIDQGHKLLECQPSSRICITERSRLRISGALRDWNDCQSYRYRRENLRTEEEWRAYHIT